MYNNSSDHDKHRLYITERGRTLTLVAIDPKHVQLLEHTDECRSTIPTTMTDSVWVFRWQFHCVALYWRRHWLRRKARVICPCLLSRICWLAWRWCSHMNLPILSGPGWPAEWHCSTHRVPPWTQRRQTAHRCRPWGEECWAFALWDEGHSLPPLSGGVERP